jgi:hypothetical protein
VTANSSQQARIERPQGFLRFSKGTVLGMKVQVSGVQPRAMEGRKKGKKE